MGFNSAFKGLSYRECRSLYSLRPKTQTFRSRVRIPIVTNIYRCSVYFDVQVLGWYGTSSLRFCFLPECSFGMYLPREIPRQTSSHGALKIKDYGLLWHRVFWWIKNKPLKQNLLPPRSVLISSNLSLRPSVRCHIPQRLRWLKQQKQLIADWIIRNIRHPLLLQYYMSLNGKHFVIGTTFMINP